jgi:hypothetical protein
MPGIVASVSLHEFRLKAGVPMTVMQTVAPERQSMKHLEFSLSLPDYGFVDGPALAHLTISIELQKGGKFANMGHVPARVSGDRAAEPPKGRYRNFVLEEPETIQVLRTFEADIHSGETLSDAPEVITEPYGLEIPPGGSLGFKITSDRELRVKQITGQHEE